MSPLTKKLLRDLWEMRGQASAIAVVILSGVATFVVAFGSMDALTRSRDAFYRDTRFADVFATVTRAPESAAERLRTLPGVGSVETRVRAPAKLEVAAFNEPITAVLLSIPASGSSLLNRLLVHDGRLPRPGRTPEAAASLAFATAHNLTPGDSLTAIVNGRRRTFTLTGIVLSPEYVYQIKPGGLFPDADRFGVLWMPRPLLAAAYDMEGAFNDVALALSPRAQPLDVLDRVDLALAAYGGQDAILRADQTSNRYVNNELDELERLATTLPVAFLAVAAFLLNVVLSRLIQTQREEIATLKAFGYANRAIGRHYAGFVLLIVAVGAVGGTALGTWMGRELAELYLRFFSFPELHYRLDPATVLLSSGVAGAAALAGTAHAVRSAVRLPPAEAMRPAAPAVFRTTILERVGLAHWVGMPTRMLLRNLERRPLKAALSVLGIAASVGIVVSGNFMHDAVDYMVRTQFERAQREDLMVTFVEPTSTAALHEIRRLPGVTLAEPFRSVPVRLRRGPREERTGIQGLLPNAELHRALTVDRTPIPIPPAGIVLTDYLADQLGVVPGDTIQVEVMDGTRPVHSVPVAARATQYVGTAAYMHLDALNRLAPHGQALNGAFLSVDAPHRTQVEAALTERPGVAAVESQQRAVASFRETMAETILTFTLIMTAFAGAIAFGVVYNSARIALSERARELASLRVLGLSRGEIGYILLGELALLTLLALPVGWLLGYGLAAGVSAGAQTEMFRVPLIVSRHTYATASAVVLAAALLSGLALWHRLGHLDLIKVLKTRE